MRHLKTLSIVLSLIFVALPVWPVDPPTQVGLGRGPADEPTGARIVSRDARGVPSWIEGDLGTLPAGDFGPSALAFLSDFARRLLGATGRETWIVTRVTEDEIGQVHVRLRQAIGELPVVGADLVVHAYADSRRVHTVNGAFAPDVRLATKAQMVAEEALEKASYAAEIDRGEVIDGPELTYVIGADDRIYLAWSARVRYQDVDGVERVSRIFADAATGGLVAHHAETYEAGTLRRRTYRADNAYGLPGTQLIAEGGTSNDAVAQTAHDHAGTVHAYYCNVHNRNSIDDRGREIRSTVRFGLGNDRNRAFWDRGRNLVVFGSGDGTRFTHLGNALDVVAHELTHGVTRYESDLIYENESGALSESISDVFAATVEAWADSGVNANTWKIAEDVTLDEDALRFMNNPTLDGSSRDWWPSRFPSTGTPNAGNDFGGVHSNSGIANLAFYLLSQGGSHPRGSETKSTRSVPAIGINNARNVFYRANRDYLTRRSTFLSARNATVRAARDLYGWSASQVNSVQAAWCAVGVPGCLTVGVSAPQFQCTAAWVTATASRSIVGGCSISSCSYSWSVRRCGVTSCTGYQPLSGSGTSASTIIYPEDSFIEFRVVGTCNTNCGTISDSETTITNGPAGGTCGGPGEE